MPWPYVPRVMPGLPVNILDAFMSVKNVAVVCVIAKLKKHESVKEASWTLRTTD